MPASSNGPLALQLTVIVKPSGEDASVGIDAGAVCTTRKALRDRLAKVCEQWEEVLIQEYVAGAVGDVVVAPDVTGRVERGHDGEGELGGGHTAQTAPDAGRGQ